MKKLSSFKKKYFDLRRVNIKKFILIFNRGLAAGITARFHLSLQEETGGLAKIEAIQRELEAVFIADECSVRKEWDNDAELRAEWEHNFDAFLGFVSLDLAGHMKVVVRKNIA